VALYRNRKRIPSVWYRMDSKLEICFSRLQYYEGLCADGAKAGMLVGPQRPSCFASGVKVVPHSHAKVVLTGREGGIVPPNPHVGLNSSAIGG
jgi:hypothetical protein